ncbi:MAG: hypothetical protein J6S79_06680 [Lachnospiraceae bacterium]|nr:hypothetical protein [Lachnospiraceae bacterium]
MRTVSIWALIMMLLFGSCSAAGASSGSSGDGLPIDVKAPQNVAVQWLEENDSPTTMRLSFSLDPELSNALIAIDQAREFGLLESMLAKYGASDVYLRVQVDWALDDVNDPVSGWHYNKYWDDPTGNGLGIDEDYHYRYSEWDVVDCGLNNASETVQEYWIMRGGVPDGDRWNGIPEYGTPGVKDQLRPDQYEYYDDSVHIDFTEHTAYFRVRFVATAVMESEDGIKYLHKFTDWSDVCGYGKDVAKVEPVTEADLSVAPVITNLRLTDEEFNGQPVVAFTITVPEELAEKASQAAAYGGSIRIQTEARVKGDAEWTSLGLYWVTSGEIKGELVYLLKEGETIVDGSKVEIRCRYFCDQSGVDETIYSPWSDVLTFETTEIKDDPKPTPTAVPDEPEDKKDDKKEEKEDKCPICGFCPQPLGLCIFIWILIAVVILAVVIVIIVLKKKKEKQS